MTNNNRAGAVEGSESKPVIVVDVQMKFTSMVVFMVKWALAAIPALLILFLLFLSIGMAAMLIVRPLWTENAAPRVLPNYDPSDPCSYFQPGTEVRKYCEEDEKKKAN